MLVCARSTVFEVALLGRKHFSDSGQDELKSYTQNPRITMWCKLPNANMVLMPQEWHARQMNLSFHIDHARLVAKSNGGVAESINRKDTTESQRRYTLLSEYALYKDLST
jgi:hypothetical protein